MAGMKPSFVTGATAKIRIGNLTLAYAQDVNYSTTVMTIPIETMGRYEVVSNEPVAYTVEGTFSVIRYTKDAAVNNMAGTAANGNGTGNWNFNNPTNAKGSEHINPGQLLASSTFDLEIFQKTTAADEPVVKIYDCRITRKSSAINKRGVLTDQFSFNAILAQDDSFNVSGSGDKDLV